MFFNDKEFVRGSDGRIYEISNPDAQGGIFIFFTAVFMAIVSAVYTAYLWLLAHYFFVASISLIGFITWTGWVYHEYQQKEGYKGFMYKFLSLLLVFAGFSLAISGCSKSISESRFLNKIQGNWVQTNENVLLSIDEKAFNISMPDEKVTIETAYQYTFDAPNTMSVHLDGKQYKGIKTPSKAESVKLFYQCVFKQDTLQLWTNQKVYKFVKKP
jgi:hypothetical protein